MPMHSKRLLWCGSAALLLAVSLPAAAQSFRVQCPSSTTLHPSAAKSPDYVGPVARVKTITRDDGSQYKVTYYDNGGAIKCQQISGGDGFATMADGTPLYLFGFGPLSGLADQVAGLPGTELADTFNQSNLTADAQSVSPDVFIGAPTPTGYTFNGAIGLVPDVEANNGTGPTGAPLDGHVDPRLIMDVGVMNANIPAPLMAIDEDDEFFLTLTNVGQVMRPDLFEQHTVHFHGYPNASSFYDGVPDASVAINVGGSFSYYYLAPDAGTYFWHCHISPPEHLQMGMVGQLFVRPRQNRVPLGNGLYAALLLQQQDLRTRCANDIECSAPLPPANSVTQQNDPRVTDTRKNVVGLPQMYAYNDGDGSTAYDVEYPIQIHGFDPNFHFVGMTFNPESFADMKDKYFLLNGRSYPDTVQPGAMTTQSTDGTMHSSQPLPTIINIPVNGRALLRIADLDVSEYQTLASLGIPMHVIGLNARLLRDLAGNDMTYMSNSITLAGGESIDVILDANGLAPGQKFYLYTPNLDHLANDAENFGGLMTEINICPANLPNIDPQTKACAAGSI
jgi:FtsP/CotA-like multicopper oxidase with cupredoxin domain